MGSHSAGRHARHGTADRRAAAPRPAGAAVRPSPVVAEPAWSRPPSWRVPTRPPIAPPGERDTITGPLSVSTTARQEREAAWATPHHHPGEQPGSEQYSTRSVLVTAPGTSHHGSGTARDWADEDLDEAWPAPVSSSAPPVAWYERPLYDPWYDEEASTSPDPWGADPFSEYDGYQHPDTGVSFTASRMPVVRPAGMVATPRADDTQSIRLPGAHRAPARRGNRGNGRVRLAAAGTVSLAGLSAIVAGVTLGGEQPGSATVPTNGDASRIQYNGRTDALAFGAAQSQAARGTTRTTPPRALPAPHPGLGGQPGEGSASTGTGLSAVTTTVLGPTTAPIPIITLVPQGTSTGPTDLRGLTPGTSATGTTGATKSPTPSNGTTSPNASPSATEDTGFGLPFTPDTPSASPGSLQPNPISITPLLPRSTS
ncbi:hypothetical protein [Frankia sp. R82]|uniref:hypothetical protein n=1 Tax=Frankia sp. R82 TaxID=2950553 RepID=UPI00204329D7|nr:hypothetical protein [Frankia sp. R82]MCM3886945.1 hypothetical protein [Frankia sp. R82]